MKLVGTLLLLVAMSIGIAQTQKQTMKPPKSHAGSSKWVTRGQFWVAYDKLRISCDQVLGIPARSGTKPAKPDELITRAEVSKSLSDLMTHYKPQFRVTPRPAWIDKKALTSNNDPETAKLLEPLVKWGFVAPVGPLVVGPGKNLTSQQTGDALGYFYLQISVLTKKALPKWTPSINPEDAG